ncbi:hypothetical protein GCK72_009730 [Caenorhabditis remanei]|uniref:Chondroitin proteoglycan 4 domain-containing protein n=1 Tax=Caenorhabditis remanei TaxID=31234 RepID=A0A6A5H405_CAERE|nr:hypothetical protein GCK72_009730 [Caenorhabditis remanei]KAF1761474.1 hypothetical protein GCK72_009730 [Caenorhabditis remanei]
MPHCLRKCMPAMDNVGMMLDVAKKPDTMKAMCQNLTEASKCATSAGCDSTFVGAISNAFQFICLDNLEKVSSQISCIQESAGDLQQECETECAVQADVIENASRNTADQLFNMEKLCNSTTCIANCYQNNLHRFCDIGEDNFLDTIFSQFETMKQPGLLGYLRNEKQNTSGIAKLFGLMMPEGCNNEKLKIKIPKKIVLPDKPKSVGSPPEVRKEITTQRKSLTEIKNSTESNDVLLAKSGNLSSAALLFNGKIQTLQCQFLDSRGKPQTTPDFETISKILSEHFNKNSPASTTMKSSVNVKTLECGKTDSSQPRSSGSTIILSSVFSIVAAHFL